MFSRDLIYSKSDEDIWSAVEQEVKMCSNV